MTYIIKYKKQDAGSVSSMLPFVYKRKKHTFPFVCIEYLWKDMQRTGNSSSSKERNWGREVGSRLFIVIMCVLFSNLN